MFEDDNTTPETIAKNALDKLNATIAFDHYMLTLSKQHDALDAVNADQALLPVLESLLLVPLKKENKLFIVVSPLVELKIPDDIKDFTIVYVTNHMDLRTRIIGGYLRGGIVPTITKVVNFMVPESKLVPLTVNL